MSSDPATADPHLADALAHAERRRAVLVRLSVIGMELAERVGAHSAAAMAAINEDKGGDPTRAFATLSRAIRLTLALEARVGAQVLALRNHRLPPGWAPGVQPAPHQRRPCRETWRGDATRENLIDRDPSEDAEYGFGVPNHPYLPRSGEGGRAATRGGRVGGMRDAGSLGAPSKGAIPNVAPSPHPACGCSHESPSPLRVREVSG
jgi:hypothetical protein